MVLQKSRSQRRQEWCLLWFCRHSRWYIKSIRPHEGETLGYSNGDIRRIFLVVSEQGNATLACVQPWGGSLLLMGATTPHSFQHSHANPWKHDVKRFHYTEKNTLLVMSTNFLLLQPRSLFFFFCDKRTWPSSERAAPRAPALLWCAVPPTTPSWDRSPVSP